MANNRDTILLETVRTHRARLLAAFLFGTLTERRVVNDNVKRLIGSVVLGAVICTVCVGYSLVTSLIAKQNANKPTPTANVTPGISDQPFASDQFDRTRKRGWGDAELGGGWTTSGSSAAYSVRKGDGVIKVSAGDSRNVRLREVPRESADLDLAVDPDRFPTKVQVTGRRTPKTGNYYRVNLRFTADHQLSVVLTRRLDGKTEPISNTVKLRTPSTPPGTSGPTRKASPATQIRMQVFGVNPTQIRAKAWPAGTSEPQDWIVTTNDPSPGLQRSGTVGMGASVASSGKNSRVKIDYFVARPVI